MKIGQMSVYDVNNENEFKCSCYVAPLLTTPKTVLSIINITCSFLPPILCVPMYPPPYDPPHTL